MTIAFNPNFLIDGVEAVPGDEVDPRDVGLGAPGDGPRRRGRAVSLPSHARARAVVGGVVGLHELTLRNFRLFRELSFAPDPDAITVLLSANGTGKTSVLEAVYALATASLVSHEAASDMIRTGSRPGRGPRRPVPARTPGPGRPDAHARGAQHDEADAGQRSTPAFARRGGRGAAPDRVHPRGRRHRPPGSREPPRRS